MKKVIVKVSHEEFKTSSESKTILKDPCVYLTFYINTYSNGKKVIGIEINGFEQKIKFEQQRKPNKKILAQNNFFMERYGKFLPKEELNLIKFDV